MLQCSTGIVDAKTVPTMAIDTRRGLANACRFLVSQRKHFRRITMKVFRAALLGLAWAGAATAVSAQNEQFIPMNGYWVGPYAPGGSGIFGGFIDYINMLNARDGGVGGVKLTYEKCETEYNNARGVECYEREKNKGPTGATVIHPLSTGITYSLIDKVAQDKIPLISLGSD